MKYKYLLIPIILFFFNESFGQTRVEVTIPTPAPACNPGDCVALTAVFPTLNQTTNYAPTPIAYSPSFPFTNGTLINAVTDDVWSPIVTLPFPFTFYGNTYNNLIVGSNGLISFDLTSAGGFCPWAFNNPAPSNTLPLNSIYCVYQDTNIASPPVTNPAVQNVNYYVLDSGVNAPPNRVFVANWNQLPQYGDPNPGGPNSPGLQTTQLVLHEGTNIIDFIIDERNGSNNGWNGSSGIIGVQNASGSAAVVPAGYNTNNGDWSANNIAFQFTPNGTGPPLNSELTWFQGTTQVGVINQPLNVCPNVTTTYTAVVKYTNPNGSTFSASKNVTVEVAPTLPLLTPKPLTICGSAGASSYTTDINQHTYILSGVPVADQGDYIIKYYEQLNDAQNDASNNINNLDVYSETTPFTFSTYPKTIYVRLENSFTFCYNIRSFIVDVATSPSGTFSYPANPYSDNDTTQQFPSLNALTSGGTYSVTPPTGLIVDPATGAFTPSGSTSGAYTITYEIQPTLDCPNNFSTTAQVTIADVPCTITASSLSESVCVNNLLTPITLTSSTGATSASITSGVLPTGVTLSNASTGTYRIAGIPTSAAIYPFTVTLETVNAIGVTTDTCSITVSIEVNDLPTAMMLGDTTICSGDTITITGTPGATVSYRVDAGAVQTIPLDAAGTATILTPVSTVDTTYALVSVAFTGVLNCSKSLLGSPAITVRALPTASISSSTTICSGDTITITGTPNATVSYRVDAGAVQTIPLDAAGTATLLTPVSTVDTTYALVSVAFTGVLNCSKSLLGSPAITVRASPTASISSSTTICSGDTITITGTPGATVSYRVDAGAVQTIPLDAAGTATLLTPVSTVDTTYALVSVAFTGVLNCSKSLLGSPAITVRALPTASISSSTTICSGDTITITGTPGATVSYRVDAGAVQTIPLDAAGTTTLLTPVSTVDTTYALVSVAFTGVLNCSKSLLGSPAITVRASPTASISSSTTICSGDIITITGTPGATVSYRIDAGAVQTIPLGAAGTATLLTPVSTVDTTYTLVSVASNGTPNCSQTLTASDTVNVLALPTASILGTTQLCLNAPEPQITFAGSNGQPPYTFTYSINGGSSQSISTSSSSSSVTLNVATTAPGPFKYDLISVSSATTPSCNQLQSDTATVTILPLPTATISGNTTTVCVNDVAPQITFTGANGQSPFTFTYTINGGASQSINSVLGNNIVSLPVSTLTAGTFVYALTGVSSATTPSCSQVQTENATVVVRPPSTLNTTSTLVQQICINTAISPIVLNIGGSATSATVSGLPNGVSGLLNPAGTVLTISGTATQTGPFNFVVTTSGGCAPNAVITGTITVSPNATIVLTSGNTNQNLCINTAVTQIGFTTGNGATGASITAGRLPLGVTAIPSPGGMIISGTALESGTFNYVVSTTGGCSSASLSGVITVKPEVDLVLTSAPITTLQTTCLNTPITPIRYSVVNGGTNATVTGLPTGVTGVYTLGVFTISGATNQIGTFNYVVTTVGGCGTASLNGSITINPDVTIVLTSPLATVSQALCINDPIVPISYELGNGATGAALIAGTVPNGIQGSYNAITKIFTISGIAIESGSFAYTITTRGGCGAATLTGSIKVNPLPVVALSQDGFICVDQAGAPTTDYTLTTNLNVTQYDFEWSDITGVIAGETDSSYTATSPGFFSVKVTNLATGCFDIGSATIEPSLPPSDVFTSATRYFEDNQMVSISVTPPGDYLYQLDTGLFQEDNYFTNLFSGNHKITVKDKYGCGEKSTPLRIVNYPKFFTPNGDGYNDTWNIFEIAADQPEAYAEIFDRFGKLIKQISVIGEGWDGTINGLTLPSTDYWFRVFYKENGEPKEFKSHFSLKR